MAARPPVTDWSSDFDPLDPRWLENPYPIWDALRQQCPVAHTGRYMGAYFPSRYADIRAIANDTEHFSSRRIVLRESPPPRQPAPPITSDPPDHRAHKAVLLPAFTPEAVDRHRPHARAVCHELIARLFGKPGCDAAVEFAQEIPVRVIAHLLGISPQAGPQFRHWIEEILEVGITDEARLLRANDEMMAFFDKEIAGRRAAPDGGLISHLLSVRTEAGPLTDEHINGTLRLLLVAGIDTTWSAIGSCFGILRPIRMTASASSPSRCCCRPRSRSSCEPTRR
jgi:cytochrome P450